jgi:hypothetical protein
VRFDDTVATRLAAFVARHRGLSQSAAANLLVDEGLRMAEHPGIVFRDGPTGRRAGLVAGPDVWELMRAGHAVRASEPQLAEDELLTVAADTAGLPVGLVRVAVRYWASHPDEIDAEISAADEAETVAEAAWRRERDLLTG